MPKLMLSDLGSSFEKVEAGQHVAICDLVADMGEQETTFGLKRKVYIRWQVVGEDATKPLSIGSTFTMSLNEKANLRKVLESWRGKRFTDDELKGWDLFSVIGAPCQLTVVHELGVNGKTYANVVTVTPLARGMQKPVLVGEPIAYSQGDAVAFDKLPEWLQKKIVLGAAPAEENKAQQEAAAHAATEPFDDEIPF